MQTRSTASHIPPQVSPTPWHTIEFSHFSYLLPSIHSDAPSYALLSYNSSYPQYASSPPTAPVHNPHAPPIESSTPLFPSAHSFIWIHTPPSVHIRFHRQQLLVTSTSTSTSASQPLLFLPSFSPPLYFIHQSSPPHPGFTHHMPALAPPHSHLFTLATTPPLFQNRVRDLTSNINCPYPSTDAAKHAENPQQFIF